MIIKLLKLTPGMSLGTAGAKPNRRAEAGLIRRRSLAQRWA